MFDALSTEANTTVQTVFGLEGISVNWQPPREDGHGDLMTTIALQLAKKVGQSPRDIAQKIAAALASSSSIEKIEVAGAGYVNVWLKPAVLLQELKITEAACTAQKARKGEAPVIVEYSSPNIAKPLGIHHILSTIIGQSIANLYEHLGYYVIHWNYIADWGVQFGKLSVAHRHWGTKSIQEYTLDELLTLYVRFHKEVDAGKPELEEEARKEFKKLEDGDAALRTFLDAVVATTKISLAHLYKRLHVSFDVDLGEGFYEDKMAPVIEEGKRTKVFVEGEKGALITNFAESTGLPPYMIVKGDGATLYSTRDLAQMRYRIDTYHPQAIYIVTDIAQKLHFEQLVATCKQLQWEIPAFENILFGRMRFADGKMSTRTGNIVKLEEVIEEGVHRAAHVISSRGESIQTDDPKALAEMMGVGALVYGVLSQNRKMDIVFDWDKCLSFEGNSAPYLMYTHARACSVLRKAKVQHPKMPKDAHTFTTHERTLLSKLLQFPSTIEAARTEHLPHTLANYLYQLCQDFNAFYSADPIVTAPEAERNLRLALTSLTASVLKTGAELLTLRVPERM